MKYYTYGDVSEDEIYEFGDTALEQNLPRWLRRHPTFTIHAVLRAFALPTFDMKRVAKLLRAAGYLPMQNRQPGGDGVDHAIWCMRGGSGQGDGTVAPPRPHYPRARMPHEVTAAEILGYTLLGLEAGLDYWLTVHDSIMTSTAVRAFRAQGQEARIGRLLRARGYMERQERIGMVWRSITPHLYPQIHETA